MCFWNTLYNREYSRWSSWDCLTPFSPSDQIICDSIRGSCSIRSGVEAVEQVVAVALVIAEAVVVVGAAVGVVVLAVVVFSCSCCSSDRNHTSTY